MTTKRSEQENWLIQEWEYRCGYSSAVFSGFEPNAAHLGSGGYHCSVVDLRAHGNGNDYSNTRPDDRDFNPEYGSAIDMSMSPADMIKCHGRVRAVYDDRSDPRRQYINAINTWDGSGDAVRLDFAVNVASFASADHKFHNHQETRRRYNRDWTAVRAIASVLKGESKAAYIASIGGGGDMAKIFSVSDGPVKNGLYGSGGSGWFWFTKMADVNAYKAEWSIPDPPATGWPSITRAQADGKYGPFLGSVDGLAAPQGKQGDPGRPGDPGTSGLDAAAVQGLIDQAVGKLKITSA